MRATSAPSDPFAPTGDVTATPLAEVHVAITNQEHIALKSAAKYWQTLHRKAVGRAQWRELRYQRIVRELKAQAAKSQAALQAELELAQAQVRDLQKRLFSSKSERRQQCEAQAKTVTCRAHRGQRRGSVGHGRTLQTQPSARHEDVTLEKARCPNCGLTFKSFAGTEDAQVLEIEVKAYRRVIRRQRYGFTEYLQRRECERPQVVDFPDTDLLLVGYEPRASGFNSCQPHQKRRGLACKYMLTLFLCLACAHAWGKPPAILAMPLWAQ